jgi:hypothetical protein
MNTKNVIEIAKYKLISGTDESIFLQDSINAQKYFLDKQPGYLNRELCKWDNGEWTEIVYWDNMINAKNAETEVGKNIQNVPMFQKIDLKTFKINFIEQIQTFK